MTMDAMSTICAMPSHMKLTFGEWLRDTRKEKGLRQVDLARKMGVSRGAVGNWETDMQPPSENNVVELARVLRMDPGEIEAFISRAPRGRPPSESTRPAGRPVGKSGSEVPVKMYGRVPCDAVRWVNPEEEWEPVWIPAEWLRGRSLDDVFAVEASGDCLSSLRIDDGDTLICAWRGSRRPVNGDLVVVRIEDHVTCKRWHWVGSDIELRDGDGNVTHRCKPSGNVHVEGYVLNSFRDYERGRG